VAPEGGMKSFQLKLLKVNSVKVVILANYLIFVLANQLNEYYHYEMKFLAWVNNFLFLV
jgi:hypothetical protein